MCATTCARLTRQVFTEVLGPLQHLMLPLTPALTLTLTLTNWKAKDAAIYLVIALTLKGSTSRLGATQTNSLVNLADFCQSHVLPELQAATPSPDPQPSPNPHAKPQP